MTEVLEGVTILSEGTGYVVTLEGTIAFLCLGVIVSAFVISYVVVAIIQKLDDWVSNMIVPALIAIILLFISITSFATRYPVYKVTVDNSVPFVEFNEKYEVIKQDGLIYEVKEK